MLVQVFEQILNGLLAGACYLLIALGLTLTFRWGLVNLVRRQEWFDDVTSRRRAGDDRTPS